MGKKSRGAVGEQRSRRETIFVHAGRGGKILKGRTAATKKMEKKGGGGLKGSVFKRKLSGTIHRSGLFPLGQGEADRERGRDQRKKEWGEARGDSSQVKLHYKKQVRGPGGAR